MTSLGTLLTSFVLASTVAWPSEAGPVSFVAQAGQAETGAGVDAAVDRAVVARQANVTAASTSTGVTTAATVVTSTLTASTTVETIGTIGTIEASKAAEAAGWQTAGVARALFDDEDAQWPIQVDVTVRDDAGTTLLSVRRQVADGEPVEFDAVFETPTGERGVEGTVTPRILFGEIVELEFEVDATEASFVDLDWATYLLHRVELGPRPPVRDHVLSSSRADIVQVAGQGHQARLETRNGPLRIAFGAHPVRG